MNEKVIQPKISLFYKANAISINSLIKIIKSNKNKENSSKNDIELSISDESSLESECDSTKYVSYDSTVIESIVNQEGNFA
jgi:hypothetical protein